VLPIRLFKQDKLLSRQQVNVNYQKKYQAKHFSLGKIRMRLADKNLFYYFKFKVNLPSKFLFHIRLRTSGILLMLVLLAIVSLNALM